jgi:hypothetical protein
MSRLEAEMAAAERAARSAVDQLRTRLPASAAPEIAAALTALDRFMTINGEIVTLSRRNSNVRSLALTLGRKRTLTAQCQDQLQELEETLAKHQVTATR